ncbi:TPM domain-containing protein, partial [Pseudomonas aeruginosa]
MPPTRWTRRRANAWWASSAGRRRGAQIAVVMLPTTGTLDIEAFSDKLFQAWKLGRKAVDDGLLLVVARMTGACASGQLRPGGCGARCGRRTDHSRADGPGLREGDYAGGIEAAVDELIRLVDGETLPAAASSGAPKSRWGNCRRKPGRCWSPSSTDRWPGAVEYPGRCAGPGCSAGRCSAGCWARW